MTVFALTSGERFSRHNDLGLAQCSGGRSSRLVQRDRETERENSDPMLVVG